MADIPAWVLIANTIAVGGFGIAGSFILPKAQREAMKQERVRADAAIMRDQAAVIFRELGTLDRTSAQAFIQTIAEMTDQPIEGEPSTLPGIEELRALLAVYYPGALDLLIKHDAACGEIMKSARQSFAEATAAPLTERAEAIRTARLLMCASMGHLVAATVKEVRAYMVDAVKPYVPSA